MSADTRNYGCWYWDAAAVQRGKHASWMTRGFVRKTGGTRLAGPENQMRDVVDQMLIDVSLYPFLAVGRMPREQYDSLIAGARAELRRPELRLYFNMYVRQSFLRVREPLTLHRHVAYGRKSRRAR